MVPTGKATYGEYITAGVMLVLTVFFLIQGQDLPEEERVAIQENTNAMITSGVAAVTMIISALRRQRAENILVKSNGN